MANCPLIDVCEFYNKEMGDKPDIVAESFRLRFCRGSNAHCARWAVYTALGGEFVPGDLYPNQEERVQAILERHRGNAKNDTEEGPCE